MSNPCLTILGSTGFIGKRLFHLFRNSPSIEARGFSSEDCNLLDMDSVRDALSSLKVEDMVIMTSSITRLKENSFQSALKNMAMAENLSLLINEKKVSQLVYLSTVDVYGSVASGTVINERLLPDPQDHYAISKLTAEFILKKICRLRDIPLLILRLSGVYGPGDEGKSTISTMVMSALQEKRLLIYGRGETIRDFVHVDDIARIIEKALESPSDATVNVATGTSTSILQIAELLRSHHFPEISIEFRNYEAGLEKRAAELSFDISLLKAVFPGFTPLSLVEGIKHYIHYQNMLSAENSKLNQGE